MRDNDVDISAEAAQDAERAAAQEAAQQEAMEAAQQEALAAAQDLAAEDDGQSLADLAADDGDPFENEVEDIDDAEDPDDSEKDTADAEDTDSSTDNTVDDSDGDVEQEEAVDTEPESVNEDAFIPTADETVQSQSSSESQPQSESGSEPESEVVSEKSTRPESQVANAVLSRSGASSQARADALTSMSSAEFRRRLRDEQVKRSGGFGADEGYIVRSQLDQARRRGAQLGLIDEAALKQFDDEMAYNDATLDEDQRSAYGPGSPMYEEAKRLGYIVEGDRTSTASSMRIRDAQDARREAEERLRFNHYWQQQAARNYLAATKAVMQAEDVDNGIGAGFSQLGHLLVDLTFGDGVDDATVEEYIAAQSNESEDQAADSSIAEEPSTVVEDTVVPEETSLSESDLDDSDVAIEEYRQAQEQERETEAYKMRIREARARAMETAALDAVNTVVDERRGAESVLAQPQSQLQPQSQSVEVMADMSADEWPSLDEIIARSAEENTIDADVVFDRIDRAQAAQSVQSVQQESTEKKKTEKKEDTPVTIQEFVEAWEQFSAVERRIVLRRTGLVNADEMEEVYTELQETVQARTNERDRYHEECNQLRADLEYETGVRRDAEREVAQLRNAVGARGPRG